MNLQLIPILFLSVLLNTVKTHVILDWEPANPQFDPAIYEDALDPDLCKQQLEHISVNGTILRLRFLEAGMRIPRAVLEFNNLDMGNYGQCLGIHEEIDDSVIEGKYCMIRGPMNENFIEIAETMNWSEFDRSLLSEKNLQRFQQIDKFKTQLSSIQTGVDVPRSRSFPIESTWVPTFRMAVCIPKTCTTQEGIRGLLFNLTVLGFRYEDEFCRFKDDKPWSPGLYVAIVIFSLIGLLTVLSTGYDVWHTFIQKKDPKTASTLYRSFSVYTNGIRLTTFTSKPSNVNCIDGVRAISMFWIIAGHTYLLLPPSYNNLYIWQWIFDLRSVWITAAPYAVDTFFFLSGLLVVYTTVGKLSGKKLLISLHLFYLHRLLRMFPLLATIVLMQATIFHYIADGPHWNVVATNVENCRVNWWSTLLYIQNYIGHNKMCIMHSWYLAIDMHCYIISPIILYWVLSGKKKYAWTALTIGLLTALTIGTTYSFIKKFQGWIIATLRPDGEPNYQIYYYFNTITRASPFFVGMVLGYLLNIWKGQKPKIPKYIVIFLWISTIVTASLLIYVTHLMKDSSTWDKWIIDDLVNSFARSVWAVAIGWVIFACQYGYGGPANWLLSLNIWKLPSRISYGMYLFHYQIQFLIQGAVLQPIFFSDAYAIYEFVAHALVSFSASFFMTLLIDSPFAVLFSLLLGGGPKRPQKGREDKD